MKKELRTVIDCATFIMQGVAEAMEYSWPEDFKVKEIRARYDKVQEKLKTVDFSKLDAEELKLVRFCMWDEKTWLCPLYLQKILKPDCNDNDVRFGCIAEGWPDKDGKPDFDAKWDLSEETL